MIVAIYPAHLNLCPIFMSCALMRNGSIYQIAGYLTHLKNKKIEAFCKKIIKVCSQSDDEWIALFNRAIAVLEAVGLKESRDDIRSVAYTQSILQYCNQQLQQ